MPTKEELLQQLSLDPTTAPTPDEAQRRQQVMQDGMQNAMGMMGGVSSVGKLPAAEWIGKTGSSAVDGILSKVANGERLNAAEQLAMTKATAPAGQSATAAVQEIQPAQRYQDLMNQWRTNGGK